MSKPDELREQVAQALHKGHSFQTTWDELWDTERDAEGECGWSREMYYQMGDSLLQKFTVKLRLRRTK